MRIRLPTSELWLCDARSCAPADRISFENRRLEALQHLRRLSSDVYSMRILREGCFEHGIQVGLRSNLDVVQLMSNLLATGSVHFCRWDGGAFGKTAPLMGLQEVGAVAARSPSPAASARPAPAPVVEPDTFGPDSDASAQARALENASENGTPFCEKCAREAAGRAA